MADPDSMESVRTELARWARERAALEREPRDGWDIESHDGWKYDGLFDLVAREGVEFRPAPIPADLKRRQARSRGKCFDRAERLAMEREDLTYVEGFARAPEGFNTHHAWLTSGSGTAIDLAWGYQPAGEYLGIPLTTRSVAAATLDSGTIGGYLDSPELWRDGFGDQLEVHNG